MKILNVFSCIAAVICTIIVCAVSTFAFSIAGEDINSIPEDWIIQTGSPDSKAEIYDSALVMSCGGAEDDYVNITTSYYDIGSGEFYVHAKMTSDGADKAMYIRDTRSYNSVRILSYSDSGLKLLGSDDLQIENGKEYDVLIVINSLTKDAAAFLDGRRVYSGTYSSWKNALDMKSAAVRITNGEGSWEFADFEFKHIFSSQLEVYPEDGDVVSADNVKEIVLDTGDVLVPGMEEKSNYTLYKNDEPIAFSILRDKNKLLIIPDEGIELGGNYRLVVKSVTDLYGNQKESDRSFSFKAASDGYEFPEIKVCGITSGEKIKEGIQRTISVERLAGNVQRVEVFVNKERSAVLTQQPFSYTLRREKGEYVISVIAYDDMNASVKSEEYSVTVLENDKPVISVDGIRDAAEILYGSSEKVLISAADEDGIKKIKAEIDGFSIKEAAAPELVLSLDGIGTGEHNLKITATDSLGASTVQNVSFTVQKTSSAMYFQNNFNDYAGNNAIPSNMQGNNNRGYIEAVNVDSEHQKSICIGIDKADETKDGGAWIGIPAGGSTKRVRVGMQVYISEYSDEYYITLKGNPQENTIIVFRGNGTADFYRADKSVGKSISYFAGRWYDVVIEADIEAGRYYIYFDGECVIDEGIMDTNLKQLMYIRMYAPKTDMIQTYAAIDNVFVENISKAPTVTSIAGQGYSSTVPADTDVIYVNISSALWSGSFDKSMVTLESESGAVELLSAYVTDRTITINPAHKLKENTVYKVTVSELAEFERGVKIGAPMSGVFTTGGGVRILDGAYGNDGGADIFSATIENNTGKEIKAVMISEVWQDNRFLSATAEDIIIKNGTDDYSMPVRYAENGSVKSYVWIMSQKPVLVSNQAYRP